MNVLTETNSCAEQKDVDILYGKVNNLNDRVTSIEAREPFLKDLLERSIATGEELSKTMNNVQMTMLSLDGKIEEQAKAMADMNEEFTKAHKETNEKITQVSDKVERIEEKGKFDIWGFLNKYLPWIIVLLGIGIYGASKFIKF